MKKKTNHDGFYLGRRIDSDESLAEAAKVMRINQPKVSALIRRKLDGFSVERLIHFLNSLGQDIDIVVRQKPSSRKKAIINVYHDGGCYARNSPMAANGC